MSSVTSVFIVVAGFATPVLAQNPLTARAAILSAEDRRAPTPRDLATIRAGMRSRDPQTARIAVRALGRLERPELIPDIVPSLRHPLPEVRAEAANAIAQAAEGLTRAAPRASAVRQTSSRRGATPADRLDAAMVPLVSRLKIEADSTVRGTLCESIGRLPFTSASQVDEAEEAILASLDRDPSIDARLGVAAGFEALARTTRRLTSGSAATSLASGGVALGEPVLAALRTLAAPRPNEALTAARVRRLALEALTSAGAVDPDTIRLASADPDVQVRRLAAKAAGTRELDAVRRSVLVAGVNDASAMVRYEALRVLGTMPADGGCAVAAGAAHDADPDVALLALDTLGSCGWAPALTAILVREVHDLGAAGAPRGWHRPAHALVALSQAAPERASAALAQFTGSRMPWLRLYAARAAANLENRAALEQLASDEDDNVREAAVTGLAKVAGHAADAIFIAELGRHDPQLLRTAALSLKGTPTRDEAVPALRGALQRLVAEGHDTTRDAQVALAETLGDLGVAVEMPAPVEALRPVTEITAEELRRLQGARARVTMRGLGVFDLALITTEAPASVIRFARLAAAGYYNGLTFHRIVPNFVIQGGSPGANEYAGDGSYMRDEVGLWPHVRGAVGVSTRGRDTGDAQIFIDLVDNPRLNHVYTVFGQVLNGLDVVGQILEGDVIERVDILPGS